MWLSVVREKKNHAFARQLRWLCLSIVNLTVKCHHPIINSSLFALLNVPKSIKIGKIYNLHCILVSVSLKGSKIYPLFSYLKLTIEVKPKEKRSCCWFC